MVHYNIISPNQAAHPAVMLSATQLKNPRSLNTPGSTVALDQPLVPLSAPDRGSHRASLFLCRLWLQEKSLTGVGA